MMNGRALNASYLTENKLLFFPRVELILELGVFWNIASSGIFFDALLMFSFFKYIYSILTCLL